MLSPGEKKELIHPMEDFFLSNSFVNIFETDSSSTENVIKLNTKHEMSSMVLRHNYFDV